MTAVTAPDLSTATFEKGRALHEAGKLEQAASCYREALTRHGDDHRSMHGLGLLALQTGALHSAKPLISSAVKLAQDMPDYRVSLGRVHQASGDAAEAMNCYRAALAIDPLHYQASLNVAMLLHRTGELEQALAAYQRAADLGKDDPSLLVNHGALLNQLGRSEEALPLYKKAIALQPGMAVAHGNLGNTLAALHRYDEAIAAFGRSLALAPESPKVHANLGSCYLARGELGPARTAFETCLADAPGDITSLAMLAAILNEQGESEAAGKLMDFENLMHCAHISPTATLDLDGYLSVLRDNVLTHPSLKADPDSHTTKQGKQTGSLLPSRHPAISHLVQQIRDAVATYIAKRPDHWQPIATLPPLWSPPDHFQIDMWATVLGGGGHQTPHIHPSGWLSGVFYVEIPMSREDTSQSGWIEFGCLPRDTALQAAPLTYRHRPQAGELVLFPSYFFHRTLPLRDNKSRISIAFDIIPRRRP